MAKKKDGKRKHQKRERGSFVSLQLKESVMNPPARVATRPPRLSALVTSEGNALRGGRLTGGDAMNFFGPFATIAAPSDGEQTWRIQQLDDRTFERMPVDRLVKLMVNLSPDISKAVWDFILFMNPGHTIEAFKDSERKTKDPRSQTALNDYVALLKAYYGSMDVVIVRLTMAGAIRGAFFAEAVLNDAADSPVDLVTPDPAPVRFVKIDSGGPRGIISQIGQWVGGKWVSYDVPTICHIPIHPFPDEPYGRSLIGPSIFSALFLLSLLRDLKRVVQQQGYPRIDLSLKFEELKQAMPDDKKGDSVAEAEWIEGAINEVKEVYKKLQPDDAYVHLDLIDVKRPVGTVDSDSLGAVGELIKALERMIVRALKSMPLLMGTTDGVSEANANRQWEIHAAGVKAMQHLLETLLERLFGVVLQAMGLPAFVKVTFAELRAAELFRDEQYRTLKFKNEAFAMYMGWQDNNQAAQSAVGHDAVSDAPLQMQSTGGSGNIVGSNPDPGADRVILRVNTNQGVIKFVGTREGVIPEGAEAPLLPVPGTVTISEDEMDRAFSEWDAEQLTINGLNSEGILEPSYTGE